MTKHRKTKDSAEPAADGQSAAPSAPTAAPALPRLKPRKEAEEVKEPNAVMRLITFFKDARRELNKVTWPNRKETFTSTGVLLVLVGLSAIYLAVVDGILTRLLRLIVG
jgi:preprotein translocase subunit SecE